MSVSSQFKHLANLCNNLVSLLGIVITTISAIVMLVLFLLETFGSLSNPYVGIITYLILPLFFLTGLILIPIGIRRVQMMRMRLKASGESVPELLTYPRWDFNDVRVRRTALFIIFASVANVIILSISTYQGVHYMESVEFCGTVCHTVMKPEFTTHQFSPHSRVSCTGCHIGPGASWFVKSKLSGVRQVFAVALNTYHKPIATPVANLRPARDTCEQCHWPEKFHDDRSRIIRKYSDDEKNTPLTTALVLKVGGVQDRAGRGRGIHWWHMDPVNKVSYVADEKRETMYWVEHRNGKGEATEYSLADSKSTPQDLAKRERRVMDCVDCHNRPTHIYRLPDESVDKAITDLEVDRSLPFIKKKSVELLKTSYSSEAEAHRGIESGLKDFYQKQYPAISSANSRQIISAAKALQSIYSRNVFPEMNVTWGAYPNNLGHQDFPGCYRCHDDNHKSKDGKTITQDCSSCHDLLAVDEEKPLVDPKILQNTTSGL